MIKIAEYSKKVNIKLERTAGVPAVSRYEAEGRGEESPRPSPISASIVQQTQVRRGGGGKAKSSKKSRQTKIVKQARLWAWLKAKGGYLDTMPYYFSKSKERKAKLEYCQHTWVRERKGDALRWRSIGCGERQVCPLCGQYRQIILAREATESMLLAQTGVEVRGVTLESYGIELVLTIPKSESLRIDALLGTNYQSWVGEVSRLFKASYGFIEQWFGKGCGGVLSLDYSGETAPSEAHYHINVYLFPARREKGKGWLSLGHWVDASRLGEMRKAWGSMLSELYALSLSEGELWVGYSGGKEDLTHWLQYLYRHSLSDIWRGWRGIMDGKVRYKARKRPEVLLCEAELRQIAERLESIPSHFKRVRWFGTFADGVRGKTMAGLGLEPEEVKEESGWEREGEPATFVYFSKVGVVLRNRDGGEFFVPENLMSYSPSGTGIGRRKRWREPGAK